MNDKIINIYEKYFDEHNIGIYNRMDMLYNLKEAAEELLEHYKQVYISTE